MSRPCQQNLTVQLAPQCFRGAQHSSHLRSFWHLPAQSEEQEIHLPCAVAPTWLGLPYEARPKAAPLSQVKRMLVS